MRKSRESRLSEAEVKLQIGDWLTSLGFQVFDERQNKNRPQWKVFEVEGTKKRPDLVVRGNLTAANLPPKQGAYVAIEMKCGYKHHDVLDGFDAILEYLSDYLWGANYRIGNERIEIAAFVFATFFSQQGYLFKEEGKFDPRHIVRGPWDAYPMTFTVARLLWRQKDNLVKRFQILSGIPKVERKLRKNLRPERSIPETGVLIRKPVGGQSVLLMLSESPYHWRFEGG